MRCRSPRTVGFQADGKTLSWSQKTYSKEFATFQLPCGKCIECRLDYARQWAIRCVHEAQMHPENCFITLTYDDEHLPKDGKLDYSHFQKFMKKLRKLQDAPMGVFVTGEYGEKTKRPHWHAIIFNWAPKDRVLKYTSERGDSVYTSETLSNLWAKGLSEFGSVTFESAGYCARYAAKKLIHGRDQEHSFDPISKKSSKYAIGKKWIEKFWPDVFHYGELVLSNGKTCSIPRYYEKWLKIHQPIAWEAYVTKTKQNKITKASEKSRHEYSEAARRDELRRIRKGREHVPERTRSEARAIITDSKFKQLQKWLKL